MKISISLPHRPGRLATGNGSTACSGHIRHSPSCRGGRTTNSFADNNNRRCRVLEWPWKTTRSSGPAGARAHALGRRGLPLPEAQGCSKATSPKVATPPSACFHELIARPSPGSPRANYSRPIPPEVPGKSPLIDMWHHAAWPGRRTPLQRQFSRFSTLSSQHHCCREEAGDSW